MFQNKNAIFIAIAIVAIVITGVLIIANSGISSPFSFMMLGGGSPEKIAKQAIQYLNDNVLKSQGKTATLVSYSEESGVVKISLSIDGSTFDSYVTKDAKLFFPEAIKLEPAATNNPTTT